MIYHPRLDASRTVDQLLPASGRRSRWPSQSGAIKTLLPPYLLHTLSSITSHHIHHAYHAHPRNPCNPPANPPHPPPPPRPRQRLRPRQHRHRSLLDRLPQRRDQRPETRRGPPTTHGREGAEAAGEAAGPQGCEGGAAGGVGGAREGGGGAGGGCGGVEEEEEEEGRVRECFCILWICPLYHLVLRMLRIWLSQYVVEIVFGDQASYTGHRFAFESWGHCGLYSPGYVCVC